MASGDTVGVMLREAPPSTNYAELQYVEGGSTDAESITCWALDDTTDEFIDYYFRLNAYGGGGVTITIYWLSAAATTGNCVWGAAIRRIADDAEDLDSSHTYSYSSATDATASAAGEVDYAVITITDGANMDNIADTELGILRITRDANNGSDTLSGDALLIGVVMTET